MTAAIGGAALSKLKTAITQVEIEFEGMDKPGRLDAYEKAPNVSQALHAAQGVRLRTLEIFTPRSFRRKCIPRSPRAWTSSRR